MMRFAAIFLSAAALVLWAAPPVSAAGDVAAGEKAFRKCQVCHTVDAGKTKPTMTSPETRTLKRGEPVHSLARRIAMPATIAPTANRIVPGP